MFRFCFQLVLAQQRRGLDQHILPKLHEQVFEFVTSFLTLMSFLQGTTIFISKYYVSRIFWLADLLLRRCL